MDFDLLRSDEIIRLRFIKNSIVKVNPDYQCVITKTYATMITQVLKKKDRENNFKTQKQMPKKSHKKEKKTILILGRWSYNYDDELYELTKYMKRLCESNCCGKNKIDKQIYKMVMAKLSAYSRSTEEFEKHYDGCINFSKVMADINWEDYINDFINKNLHKVITDVHYGYAKSLAIIIGHENDILSIMFNLWSKDTNLGKQLVKQDILDLIEHFKRNNNLQTRLNELKINRRILYKLVNHLYYPLNYITTDTTAFPKIFVAILVITWLEMCLLKN